MVARSFFSLDNENFVVTSSSSAGLVGNGVINNSDTPDGTIFDFTAGGGQTITLDDVGGSADVFEDDSSANHTITDGGSLVANGQSVEAESLIFVRALDSGGNPTGPVITITVFSQNGVTSDVWGFSTDIPLAGGTSYVKTGGSNAGSSSYSSFVTCFAEDTLIDTPDGQKLIKALRVGDLVRTRDNGALPIRWVGHRLVSGKGKFAPISIAAGALGNSDAFRVSPEHRMIVESPVVEMYFGTPCILVAAKYLVGLSGITQVEVPEITYHHLLFDRHEIISGGGCWSESFFLAEHGLSGLDKEARRELHALFPDLISAQAQFGSTAERVLKKHEANILVAMLTSAGNTHALAA